MSVINLIEHADAPRPIQGEGPRKLSPDKRAILSAVTIFLSVLALALPLTYLANEAARPEPKSPEPTKQEPLAAPAAAKPPATVERSPVIPTDMRAAVIARVQELINQGNYQRAIDVADTYLSGSELHHLWELRVFADESMAANREQEILKELSSIPGRQYKLNRDKYAQLVALNPDEPKYFKKLQYYQEKYLEHETRLSRTKQ